MAGRTTRTWSQMDGDTEGDALTAHKTCPATNGRAASTCGVCDLPPHLLGASPQPTPLPILLLFTTLTLTHMTAGTSLTHCPPLPPEPTPGSWRETWIGWSMWLILLLPPSLAAAADSHRSPPLLSQNG